MFGYIYKITNKVNGKAYVGKTTDTVQVRWKEHLKDFKRKRCANRPLYRAIRKYGIDAFNVETIEEADLVEVFKVVKSEEELIKLLKKIILATNDLRDTVWRLEEELKG